MKEFFDGLFRVLDLRAVLAIVLLCFELLQEAETRRSSRMSRSAMLGHTETLLAALRHSITSEAVQLISLHPGALVRLRGVYRKFHQAAYPRSSKGARL